nr:hypothetical protein BaRGS_030726 [Batillaria attramentaria]
MDGRGPHALGLLDSSPPTGVKADDALLLLVADCGAMEAFLRTGAVCRSRNLDTDGFLRGEDDVSGVTGPGVLGPDSHNLQQSNWSSQMKS